MANQFTPLPDPPSRADPANFAAKGDAFLGALPLFQVEANDIATEAEANKNTAVQAVADATEQVAFATEQANIALTAKDIAVGAANFRGEYNPATTYQIGQSVSYLGERYIAKTVNTGIEPVDGVNWLLISRAVDISSVADGDIKSFFSSTTWVVPETAIYKIHVIGGGGAGANDLSSVSRANSGGGAGGYAIKTVELTEGDSYTITIGAGGILSGESGGNTSITGNNVSITANGGAGGVTVTTANVTALGGVGGTASGGDVNFQGSDGGNAEFDGSRICAAGGGAVALLGIQHKGGDAFTAVAGANCYGGGSGVGGRGASNQTQVDLIIGGTSGFPAERPVMNSFTPKGEFTGYFSSQANSPPNARAALGINHCGVGSNATFGTNYSITSPFGGSGAGNNALSIPEINKAKLGGGGGGKTTSSTAFEGGDGVIFIYKVTAQ